MKNKPAELPVPSWAGSMVSNYRRSQNLPDRVTDGMIFARIEEYRSMDPDDIEEMVGLLAKETL